MKLVALAVVSLVFVAGCEGMGRQDAYTGPVDLHQPPARGDAQAARLEGTWGTFIDQVDGMPVQQQPFYTTVLGGGLGGNKTAVAAGPRELRLFVTRNDDYYYTSFVFDFEPGHSYDFCRALNIGEEKIRIHDQTAGTYRYVR